MPSELRHVTPQQLDPVGRVTAYYFTIAVGLVSTGAAVGLTLNPSGYAQLSNPGLAAFAIVVLAGAFAAFAVMANPRGPMLSRLRFQVVFALLILANILSALSQAGSNHFARDDWGPICLGLALLACAPYRSSYEILWFTVQGVVAAGILSAFQSYTSHITVAGIIVVVVSITPALGIGLGAAAYSRALVSGLRRFRAAETEARREHDDELRQRLLEEDSVGQLGALRSEVVPFFERLAAQDYLSDEDSVRARELSAGLRLAIVERLAVDPLAGLVAEFSDPAGVSRSLSERQRAALRALIVAATEIEDAFGVALAFSRARDGAEGARGSLAFSGGDPDRIRTALQPFVRMLGFVFGDAKLTNTRLGTTVRFASTRTD